MKITIAAFMGNFTPRSPEEYAEPKISYKRYNVEFSTMWVWHKLAPNVTHYNIKRSHKIKFNKETTFAIKS